MTAEPNPAPVRGKIITLAANPTLQIRQDLIETLPLAIYACDAAGRILWFNSRATELWGRTPAVGDDSERYCGSYRLYFNGRQISHSETPMAHVLATGEAIRGVEGRVVRPDGSCIWAMVHIEPVHEYGKLVGAINCFHETTALHESAQDLDDFFENAAVGLHLVSENGTILRANRAELAMLGYSAEEYVGRNIRDLHVDEPTIDDILKRLKRREAIDQFPARLRAKDGSIRHVLITSNARTKDGRFVNTRCFTVDVTDRVRADELIREQERRLTATYEHAGSGIVEVDADGRLLRVNTRLCELMGRTADELLGRSIFDETFFDDVKQDREQFGKQIAGNLDRYTIEKRLLRSDGSSFWASVTSTCVQDPNGTFLYAVRVQNDISDQKKAQEDLALQADNYAALHRFVDGLQHARSIEDVQSLALDAIRDGLCCQRASILQFDKAGVMRFVASQGLSERYRTAVDGHSPWARDDEFPEPIYLSNIELADLPGSLKEDVVTEGIQAVAFIPIMDSGGLLGKLMAYYDCPHEFTEAEREVALTLARQLGAGIERMRSQKAAQQLAAIIESSHDAIVSKDLDGIVQTWNRGAEILFGYTASEIVGKPITMVIPQDRLDEESHILGRIRNGEAVDHFETIRRRKDGSDVDVSLTISPVRDAKGRIVGASKITRNITERKEAEAKIRESKQHLQDLLAAIPAAIYTTDAQGKITYFNETAVELAGRTPNLGSDEFCVTWKLYWPDGTPLPHDQCPMAVSLREGRAVRGVEAVAERPDGTRVPFIPYPTPMRDASGKIVGGINMLVDISERKQAESQQRLLLDELNHRVKNNMQMLQSLLLSAAKRSDSSEARKVLEEATGRIASMAAAQRVLYDTVDAMNFKAPQFLDAVCQTVQQIFPSHVTIDSEAAHAELPNDVAMPLALIVNELLTNAVKHGATEQTAQVIRVTFARDDGSYSLTVEDQGAGFDLEAVRHKSSGLRLVEGLARQLQGTFTVTRGSVTRCILKFS